MPHSVFGWDLPPGVSIGDIERAYGGDEPPTPTLLGKATQQVVSTLMSAAREEGEGAWAVDETSGDFTVQLRLPDGTWLYLYGALEIDEQKSAELALEFGKPTSV